VVSPTSRAAHLGIELPLGSAFDVGCGTGRLAELVVDDGPCCYRGVDIAIDAVHYCQDRGLRVSCISGPADIGPWADPWHWILCVSVFTHVDRAERLAYVHAFAAAMARPTGTGRTSELLVDIIPGDGAGDVTMWTADVAEFEGDLVSAGWHVSGVYERTSPDGRQHRYYRCTRADALGGAPR
jgi:SAM-dependent methyltransferase